jgi:HEAT repeat protein
MPLHETLRSADMRKANSALRELSSLPTKEAIVHLEQLAVESNHEFRCRAVAGMASISTERCEALAIRFLSDTAPSVRVNAIDALRKLRSRPAAPLIARILAADPDDLVRSWAAFSLGEIGDASVLPALLAAA